MHIYSNKRIITGYPAFCLEKNMLQLVIQLLKKQKLCDFSLQSRYLTSRMKRSKIYLSQNKEKYNMSKTYDNTS